MHLLILQLITIYVTKIPFLKCYKWNISTSIGLCHGCKHNIILKEFCSVRVDLSWENKLLTIRLIVYFQSTSKHNKMSMWEFHLLDRLSWACIDASNHAWMLNEISSVHGLILFSGLCNSLHLVNSLININCWYLSLFGGLTYSKVTINL